MKGRGAEPAGIRSPTAVAGLDQFRAVGGGRAADDVRQVVALTPARTGFNRRITPGVHHDYVHSSDPHAPKPPVQVEMLDPQRSVCDFGEVMTGRIRCVVTGSTGARLRVLSGEQRAKDGAVICVNVLVAGDTG